MKKIAMLLAPGFQQTEALSVHDATSLGGEIQVDFISTTNALQVVSNHSNFAVSCITTLQELLMTNPSCAGYDALVIPGGREGVNYLARTNRVFDIIKVFYQNQRLIGAICAGPEIIAKSHLFTGASVTCYPAAEIQNVLRSAGLKVKVTNNYVEYDPDFNLMTSQGPATALMMGVALQKYFKTTDCDLRSQQLLLDHITDHH